MTNHTPTPWKIYDDADPHHIKILGRRPDIGNAHVADVLFPENAAFIVKACNSHDALVKALEAACGYLTNAKIDLQTGCTKATAIKTIDGGVRMIREALAKVSQS